MTLDLGLEEAGQFERQSGGRITSSQAEKCEQSQRWHEGGADRLKRGEAEGERKTLKMSGW